MNLKWEHTNSLIQFMIGCDKRQSLKMENHVNLDNILLSSLRMCILFRLCLHAETKHS